MPVGVAAAAVPMGAKAMSVVFDAWYPTSSSPPFSVRERPRAVSPFSIVSRIRLSARGAVAAVVSVLQLQVAYREKSTCASYSTAEKGATARRSVIKIVIVFSIQ
jgi:hypothetical protein